MGDDSGEEIHVGATVAGIRTKAATITEQTHTV